MDKWYFSLTDGRRVGKDFFLYKDMGEKVTLSRRESWNIVSQTVERCLTVRWSIWTTSTGRSLALRRWIEYKEMLDLLIQLRTPKLSKDFKPSVINDILSDSAAASFR